MVTAAGVFSTRDGALTASALRRWHPRGWLERSASDRSSERRIRRRRGLWLAGAGRIRRGRRHIGVGFPRIAVGLGGGAAEIIGVGGEVAEAAHGRRYRRRRGIATARRA
jgi:hypothetical protein